MPTSTEAVAFSNISATTAAFKLRGGTYAFTVVATFGGGTVKLQTLAGDGSTWVDVSSQTVAANVIVYCGPGQYRFAIATATAVYVVLCSIPS